MTPFANWTFFGLLLLYAVLPILVLGLFGKASAKWCFIITLPILFFVFAHHDNTVLRLNGVLLRDVGSALTTPWTSTTTATGFSPLANFLPPGFLASALILRTTTEFSPFYLFLLCIAWQMWVPFAFLRWKSKRTFLPALLLTLAPLTLNRLMPFVSHESVFGFVGISYVTFRALDVIFSIRDGVVKSLAPGQLFAFLFFFPTVSSGPIDRYRRFGQDWAKARTRSEFLDDLDFCIQRVMRGFLYKFIIAAQIDAKLRVPLLKVAGLKGYAGYMYVYTFYLFFDFAGYTAFAVGVSRLMGIKSAENFNLPFLARNIRDFWTRWHISLSFWFRDHVHMRFQLAAAKGKWFKGKHTASYLGLFITFGLMGVWHGLAWHYIIYGMYHAVLLCGYDWFSRWNKTAKVWGDGPWWRALNIGITFHVIVLGMLLFSGRLSPVPPPTFEAVIEEQDSHVISGYVWQKEMPVDFLTVDIYADHNWAARSRCTIPRPDLKEKGYGDGNIGFRAEMPGWLRNGLSHIIEVRIVEGNRLVGKPKMIPFPDEPYVHVPQPPVPTRAEPRPPAGAKR